MSSINPYKRDATQVVKKSPGKKPTAEEEFDRLLGAIRPIPVSKLINHDRLIYAGTIARKVWTAKYNKKALGSPWEDWRDIELLVVAQMKTGKEFKNVVHNGDMDAVDLTLKYKDVDVRIEIKSVFVSGEIYNKDKTGDRVTFFLSEKQKAQLVTDPKKRLVSSVYYVEYHKYNEYHKKNQYGMPVPEQWISYTVYKISSRTLKLDAKPDRQVRKRLGLQPYKGDTKGWGEKEYRAQLEVDRKAHEEALAKEEARSANFKRELQERDANRAKRGRY